MDAAALETWYLTAAKENKMLAANADAKIAAAYNYDTLNFLPLSGSPVLNASYWAEVSSKETLVKSGSIRNYPNPFSGSTTIALNIENSSMVKIAIYNSMGTKVGELCNGTIDAGNHEFTFNATSMPKGIYVGVVTVNQSTSTIKMIAR